MNRLIFPILLLSQYNFSAHIAQSWKNVSDETQDSGKLRWIDVSFAILDLSGLFHIHLRRESTVFSLRGFLVQERSGSLDFFNLFDEIEPIEDGWDVGLLAGKIWNFDRTAILLSSGLGIAGGNSRGRFLKKYSDSWLGEITQYENINYLGLGVPLETNIMWTPSRFFGLNLHIFTNINFYAVYAGWMVGFSAGNIQ